MADLPPGVATIELVERPPATAPCAARPTMAALICSLGRAVVAPGDVMPLWIAANPLTFYTLALLMTGVFGATLMVADSALLSTTEHVVVVAGTPQVRVRTRPILVIWNSWLREGAVVFSARALSYVAPVLIGALGLSFLALPFAHRHGRPLRSFAVAMRAVASQWLTAFGCAVVIAVSLVVASRWLRSTDLLGFVGVVMIPLLAWRVIRRIESAARRVRELTPGSDWTPLCENCGYDLTAPPSDGRCPECGARVAEMAPARAGTLWQRPRRDATAWVATTLTVLFAPRAFYRALRVRDDGVAAEAFANFTFLWIGILAASFALLAFGAFRLGAVPLDDVTMMAGLAVAGYPLAMWFGLRLGGAVVMTFFFSARPAPDERWAAAVIDYESAYLWVYSIWWAANLVLGFTYGDYVGHSAAFALGWSKLEVDRAFAGIFGASGIEAVNISGPIVLALVWLRRYTLAWRSLRWANA